jgi:hypothetical protein
VAPAKPDAQNSKIKKKTSVAEQHHLDAAPALGKNFDAAPVLRLLSYHIADQLFKKEKR